MAIDNFITCGTQQSKDALNALWRVNNLGNRRSISIEPDGMEFICHEDGRKEFIREPNYLIEWDKPNIHGEVFRRGAFDEWYKKMIQGDWSAETAGIHNEKDYHLSDAFRYGIDFGHSNPVSVTLADGHTVKLNYGDSMWLNEAASYTEEAWKQLGEKLKYICSSQLDFSHLNINKMKMEALNKANELNRNISDLKEHKRHFEKVSEQDMKEPNFSLRVQSREGTLELNGLNKKFIPSTFAKQYLANIDKEIKRLEREIEKL